MMSTLEDFFQAFIRSNPYHFYTKKKKEIEKRYQFVIEIHYGFPCHLYCYFVSFPKRIIIISLIEKSSVTIRIYSRTDIVEYNNVFPFSYFKPASSDLLDQKS